MSSNRDRIIALRQARIAYWMARRRLSRLNTEEDNGPRRGQALRDCWRARQHLHDEIVRTRGWLDGRKALRAEQARARRQSAERAHAAMQRLIKTYGDNARRRLNMTRSREAMRRDR